MLAAFAALLTLASCVQEKPRLSKTTPAPPSHPTVIIYHDGDYTGNAVCAECHNNITQPYSATHHATTLHLLGESDASAVSPPTGYIGHSDFLIRASSRAGVPEVLHVGGPGSPIAEGAAPLQLAVGSGVTGVSYVSALDNEHLLIMRYSYFPHERKWFPTPRPSNIAPDAPGEVLQTTKAQHCIECHTTSVPADTLIPERRFLSIGCEACHGPGGSHVNAMRHGKFRELHLSHLSGQSAADTIRLCGHCHETESNIQTVSRNGKFLLADDHGHGNALAKSQCYLKSQGKLTCTTCHDPHADSNHDETHYVAICLRCHARPTGSAQVSCPINPTDHCISCHMPRHPEVPGTQLPATLTSHYIAIYRK